MVSENVRLSGQRKCHSRVPVITPAHVIRPHLLAQQFQFPGLQPDEGRCLERQHGTVCSAPFASTPTFSAKPRKAAFRLMVGCLPGVSNVR